MKIILLFFLSLPTLSVFGREDTLNACKAHFLKNVKVDLMQRSIDAKIEIYANSDSYLNEIRKISWKDYIGKRISINFNPGHGIPVSIVADNTIKQFVLGRSHFSPRLREEIKKLCRALKGRYEIVVAIAFANNRVFVSKYIRISPGDEDTEVIEEIKRFKNHLKEKRVVNKISELYLIHTHPEIAPFEPQDTDFEYFAVSAFGISILNKTRMLAVPHKENGEIVFLYTSNRKRYLRSFQY